MVKTTGQDELLDDLNVGNLPPKGDKRCGEFFNKLWEEARDEKIVRLDLHQRWLEIHQKFRGVREKNLTFPKVGANYLFKIVQSFCAILTEKYPQAEVQPSEEIPDEQIKALNAETTQWWIEDELQNLLYATAQNMLLNGTTIEKFVFDSRANTSKVILRDPFNFFPAPGYRLCTLDIPYCCDAYFLEPWEVRSQFNIPDDVKIPMDADEHLFGLERETVTGWKPKDTGTHNLPSNYSIITNDRGTGPSIDKTLVVEVWCRDYSTEVIKIEGQIQAVDNTGNPVADDQGRPIMTTGVVEEIERPVYPGSIRKVTICPSLMKIHNNGILDDAKNPNVNWGLVEARKDYLMTVGLPAPAIDEMGNPVVDPQTGQPVVQPVPVPEEEAHELALDTVRSTWLFDRYPFSAVPSMIDTTQWWGFSILEQLEALQGKQEAILTKYFAYIDRIMFPMLIIPVNSGIKNSQVTNAPGLVLNPTVESAKYIRYVLPPPPPQGLLEMLQFLLYQMDIISMSPEVTEGRKPKGVSAASAIIALQDKASTLFQPNIWKIDEIVRNRGNAHVSMVLNFGTKEKPIKVDREFVKFVGTDIVGRFKFYVESGSSAPITKQGRRQQYVELFRLGALTVRPLLEMLEVPDKVIEMVLEEKSVPGAIQLLVSAGLAPEMAQQIYKVVMQNPGMGAEQGPNGNPGEGMQTNQPTGPNTNNERMKTIYQNMSTVG